MLMTMTFYNSFRMHFGECLSFLSVKSTQCMVSCFGFYSTWSFIVKNIYVCDELYYPVPGFSGDQFILFLMFSLFHEAQSQINSGLFYFDDYFYNNLLSWCYSLFIALSKFADQIWYWAFTLFFRIFYPWLSKVVALPRTPWQRFEEVCSQDPTTFGNHWTHFVMSIHSLKEVGAGLLGLRMLSCKL